MGGGGAGRDPERMLVTRKLLCVGQKRKILNWKGVVTWLAFEGNDFCVGRKNPCNKKTVNILIYLCLMKAPCSLRLTSCHLGAATETKKYPRLAVFYMRGMNTPPPLSRRFALGSSNVCLVGEKSTCSVPASPSVASPLSHGQRVCPCSGVVIDRSSSSPPCSRSPC